MSRCVGVFIGVCASVGVAVGGVCVVLSPVSGDSGLSCFMLALALPLVPALALALVLYWQVLSTGGANNVIFNISKV